MTVLDAYAVLAYFRGEAAAPDVATLLRGGDCALTALGVAETVDRLIRLDDLAEDAAVRLLALLPLAAPVPVEAVIGRDAGRLRARHYHRQRWAVGMADCVTAISASVIDEPVATADPALLDLCHEEGIAVHPLPASDGSIWAPP